MKSFFFFTVFCPFSDGMVENKTKRYEIVNFLQFSVRIVENNAKRNEILHFCYRHSRLGAVHMLRVFAHR